MPYPKGKFKPAWPRLLTRRTIEGDCWIWQGSHATTGYGTIGYQGTTIYVHRLVYELVYGAIPEGLFIDHLCRRRDCFQPEHLEAVTNAENIRRGNSPSTVAARTGICSKGHEMTPENTYHRPDRPGWKQCRTCNHLRYVRRRDAVVV